jgi:two-component system chemotaxis response regulator CheY
MTRILITDDATFMRIILKNTIAGDSNLQVVGEATNGVDMLIRYEELKPDIVLLDITMPEMDGLTALKKLTTKHPDAKVIMCTAMGQQAMVMEAIQYGAKDFIVKPFKPEKVLQSIRCVAG